MAFKNNQAPDGFDVGLSVTTEGGFIVGFALSSRIEVESGSWVGHFVGFLVGVDVETSSKVKQYL